jgi:uncharacterized repeat protein (TIGR04138 family)
MDKKNFHVVVDEIRQTDDRYAHDAYLFISEAVSFTAQALQRKTEADHHITGQELLEGISDYAIDKFGPLAGEVLEHWGINNSKAIGDVVFNMVNNNLLRASDNDSITDFENGPDFDKTFRKPFIKTGKKNIKPPIIA